MSLNPGSTLGQYRIDELIGEGGFATVYKGYQPSLERPVAIKVLSDQLSHKPNFVERFRREAEATFSLKHPNIVEVFDFQEIDSTAFMVMEYVDGPSLRDVLTGKGAFDIHSEEEEATRHREEIDGTRLHEDESDLTVMKNLTGHYEPIPVGVVAQIAEHVCAALTYAHKEGVVHRDLKPDNVLISRDGRALLTDFGIARVQEESRLTSTGSTMGTWAYMSPEQFSKPNEVNSLTDIYSLGIMLYELLTGSVPFVGGDSTVVQKHLSEKPLKPRTLRGDIPLSMEKVVLKCLEKKPEKRFPTTEGVAQAILAKTKPISLTVLLGTGTEKGISKKEKEGASELVCPQCGYGFSLEEKSVECPACGTKTNQALGKEEIHNRLRSAQGFMERYHFDLGLSMDVKAFLYRKTVKPDLIRKYEELVKEWKTSIKKGSVVPPTTWEEGRPDKKKTLATIKKLLDFVALWESPTLNEYVVELEERRERKKRAAGLEGRAFQLLGLYHSQRAAEGQTNEQMVSQYELARMWFEHAEQSLITGEPELAPATGFSRQFADVVLKFSRIPEGELPKIKVRPQVSPSVKADLVRYNKYKGVWLLIQEKLGNLREEANHTLDKVKDQIDLIKQRLAEIKSEVEAEQELYPKRIDELKQKYERKISKQQSVLRGTSWIMSIAPWVTGFMGLIIAGSNIAYLGFAAYGLLLLALSLGILYVRLPNNSDRMTRWDASVIIAGVVGLLLCNFLVGIFCAILGAFGLWLVGSRWQKIEHSNPVYILLVILFAGAPAIFIEVYPFTKLIPPGSDFFRFLPAAFLSFSAGVIIGSVYRRQKQKLDSIHSHLQDTLSEVEAAYQNKLNLINLDRIITLDQFTTSTEEDIKIVVSTLKEAEIYAHQLSLKLLRAKTPQELAQTKDLHSYLVRLNRARGHYIKESGI